MNTEFFQSPKGDYSILEVLDRRGNQRIAVDTDVVIAPRHGRQLIPFVLSAQARQSDAADLEVKIIRYGSMQMHHVLSQWIYQGRSVTELSWPAWVAGLTVFVLCIVLSARHGKRRRTLQDGQRLRGPQVVTVSEFNHWNRGDGIEFSTTHRHEILRIPGSLESSHTAVPLLNQLDRVPAWPRESPRYSARSYVG